MSIRNATIVQAWREAAADLIEQAQCLHDLATGMEVRAHRWLALAETMERPAGAELHALPGERPSEAVMREMDDASIGLGEIDGGGE